MKERGVVALCADFGDFPSELRAEDLAAILPKTNSIHARADYPGGQMDRETYKRHIKLAIDSGFDGPISPIYQDADGTWERIGELCEATLEALSDSYHHEGHEKHTKG